MPLTCSAATPGATRRLGERVGRLLRAGDAVLLSGDLGTGKTVLAQGIARGMGVHAAVKSSSFVILNQYDAVKRGRVMRLYHADLYRLDDAEQVAELALEETAAAGVLVVEWPARALGELPEEHLGIELSYGAGAKTREIAVTARGRRYEAMLEQLTTQLSA